MKIKLNYIKKIILITVVKMSNDPDKFPLCGKCNNRFISMYHYLKHLSRCPEGFIVR